MKLRHIVCKARVCRNITRKYHKKPKILNPVYTVQATRNITFTKSILRIFLSFTKNYEFRNNLCTESKRKKKFAREISKIRTRILKNEEIHVRILNKKRNLSTNLNKPTGLHLKDRYSKTSSFDNSWLV